MARVEEERKEVIRGCMGIKRDLSHRDAGRAHFCGAGKGKMRKKGKEGEERDPKPL